MIDKFYEEYFQIIEDGFGRYFKDSNPIESVNRLLKQPMTSRMLYETSETVIDEIHELFKINETKNLTELSSLKGIKTNFCGSVSPQEIEKFLCQTGLYVDTTVISDPITFVHILKPYMDKHNFTESLFRHAFKMLKLKNALINDSEIPILKIIESPSFLEKYDDKYGEADKQTLQFFNDLFDEDFETLDKLQKMILEIKTTKELTAKIRNKELLIPEIKEYSDIEKGFESFSQNFSQQFKSPVYTKINTASSAYYTYNIGSFRSNLLNFNFSKEFRLINSFDSENSWHNYNWLLENQAKMINKQTMVINSLTLEKIKWLGNLKLNDVIIAREKSCMQEFRELINKEINLIDDSSIDEVADQINYNVEQAFVKHQNELQKIEEEYSSNYAISYSGVVIGSFTFLHGIINKDSASALFGGMSLVSSLWSYAKTMKDYCNNKNKITSSPIGLLVDVQGNKYGRER